MNKKQLVKKILSAFTISAFIMGTASPLYTTTKASSTDYSTLAMMLEGGGYTTGIMTMKISKYVSYSYISPDNAKVFIMCKAGNKASRIPVEGDEGTYICIAQAMSSNIIIPTNPQTRNVTFKEAGKSQTVTMSFPYQTATVNKKNERIEQNASNDGSATQAIDVNIRIKVPQNKTTQITSGDSDAVAGDAVQISQNTGTDLISDTGNNSKTKYNADGSVSITTCSDGSLFCPEDQNNINDPRGTNSGGDNQGGDNPGEDNPGGTNETPNGDDLKKDPDKQQSVLNTNPFGTNTTSSNDNYKNLLDDLLDYNKNNTDPYNSSDADWANSGAGTDGEGNLDDWFGGVDDGNNLPTNMTTDDTGVDDVIANNMENPNGGDTYTPNSEYNDVVLDYNGDNSSDDNNSSYLPMEDLDEKFQEGLDTLSGLNGNNSGLLGAIDSESVEGSLGDKLKDLLGNNSINNARKGTASDQELYDIAKKWLLANGFTMNDIRNGKNYDANSAYTEPTVAWDMNRITTLLKGRKISLTSPTEVKKDNKSKSTLSQSTTNSKR